MTTSQLSALIERTLTDPRSGFRPAPERSDAALMRSIRVLRQHPGTTTARACLASFQREAARRHLEED